MKLVIVLIIKLQVISLVSPASFDFMTNLNNPQVPEKRVERETKPTYCLQPPVTADKSYTVKLPHQDDTSDAKPGESVPKYSIIVSRCKEGYAADYENDEQYELPSLCTDKSWSPQVLKCKKSCDNFSRFSNFNMTCYKHFGGPKISCTGLLLERAIAIPTCSNKYHPDSKVNYEYATCLENGKWDKTFFKCIPDCGKIASSSVPLISGGQRDLPQNAPWNVAIYSSELSPNTPEFICGGTLINSELFISAAHCFYDDVFRKKKDITFFHAMVGKATRDYNTLDSASTKVYKLKHIYFPDITYQGASNNYASDIAILQLSDQVTFSRDVLPACLHWEDRDRFNPDENIMGKLSGFGATSNGSLASLLLSAQLPYISYKECLEKVANDFLISVDKFCAGSLDGPGARPGDSGGGLLFVDKTTKLYFLRGVVSTKDLSASSIATITDITQYISWISRITKSINPKPGIYNLQDEECGCNPDGSTQTSCNSRSAPCQCKLFVTGRKCDTCKDGFWNLKAYNPDGCVACQCNSMGSLNSICDKISGLCQCKPNVIGRQCDKCDNDTKLMGLDGCKDSPTWVKYSDGGRCSNAVLGGYFPQKNENVFIARHRVEEYLLFGKLIPIEKTLYIPWRKIEKNFSEYEVLCGGSVEWVPAYMGEYPRGALVGTVINTDNGQENIYICKAPVHTLNDKYVVAGMLRPSQKRCYIGNGGYELLRSEYEVLVQHSTTARKCDSIGSLSSTYEGTIKICKCKPNVVGQNCDRCAPNRYKFGPQGCKAGPNWLKYSNGDKCRNALVGGYDILTNETLFVARNPRNNNLVPGRLVPSRKVAVISIYNAPSSSGEYEVLCGGSTKWIPASYGDVPEDAFAGGLGHGDYGPELLYVCRAFAADGSLLPGWLHRTKNFCFFAFNGGEYTNEVYEMLQVV